MILYHIHVLNNHDKLFEKNKEFVIGDNFKNRLYHYTKELSFSVPVDRYKYTVNLLNEYNMKNGYRLEKDLVNFSYLFPLVMSFGTDDVKRNALEDSKRLLHFSSMLQRELSIEEYRKDNDILKPSRLHCLYACTLDGLDYWDKIITNNYQKVADIFKIEVEDNQFHTNEQLLPNPNSNYIDSYNSAKRYFNPKAKDLNTKTDEYLIKGKVKILSKEYQIR